MAGEDACGPRRAITVALEGLLKGTNEQSIPSVAFVMSDKMRCDISNPQVSEQIINRPMFWREA